MNASEKIEWQKKAKPILLAHLKKSIGYPNCTDKAIMEQVGPMWAELVASGLIVEGMTFQMFVTVAQRRYMEKEMWRIIGL